MVNFVYSVRFFLFSLGFLCGNAEFNCPHSGVNSMVYLDLEQLSLIALQQGFNNVIQSPKLCRNGTDEECSQQQCCHGEVGCCYNDLHLDKRKCGCKKIGDLECTFRAPYAIMANTECEANKKTEISGCLREKRGNEESSIGTWNKNLIPVIETKYPERSNILLVLFEKVDMSLQNL